MYQEESSIKFTEGRMNAYARIVLGLGSLLCQWMGLVGGVEHLAGHAAPAVGSCRATLVHTTPFRRPDLRDIPWLVATPASAGITGILFFRHLGAHGTGVYLHTGGRMPDGSTTKVLWLINNSEPGSTLKITGRNLTGSGTMHQTFTGSREVPSIVNIPTPGCWELQLRSGRVQGTVTMPVV